MTMTSPRSVVWFVLMMAVVFAPSSSLQQKPSHSLSSISSSNKQEDENKEFDFWFKPNCFNFPEEPFSEDNYVVDLHKWLVADQIAPDFVLKDVEGTVYQLSELLTEKPVFLQFGSYTCPNYRKYIDMTNYLLKQWGDDLHFVVVYVIEAHPEEPDVSPYKGEVSEGPWSDFKHLTTYEDRLVAAKLVEPLHDEGTIFLIDTLEKEFLKESNNWVWCQYGPAANPGYIIRQDGTIEIGMEWFTPSIMEAAFARLIDGVHEGPAVTSTSSIISSTSNTSLAIALVFMFVLIFSGAYLIAQHRRRKSEYEAIAEGSTASASPHGSDSKYTQF